MSKTQQANHVGYRRAAKISKAFFSLFATFDFPERPEVLDEGGAIIAANHRSFFDLFLAYAFCFSWGETPRMLVRGSYFELPIIGWVLKSTGCIPVHSGGGKAALDEGLEELNANRSIAIMPEGRLVKAEDRPTGVGEAREGVGVLAIKSGLPVITMGVSGSERVWPIGKPMPIPRLKRTHVALRYNVIREVSGSAVEAKDTIMESLTQSVREAEAVSGLQTHEIS